MTDAPEQPLTGALTCVHMGLVAACFDAKNGHFAFMPCGHAVACEKCCKSIVRSYDPTCPICRIQIKKIKKIFI